MAKSATLQSRELESRLVIGSVRYAGVMIGVALLMGLIFREVSRPFFKGVSLEDQLLYGHAMSTVHGHTFLLGAAIPLGLAVMTYLARQTLTPKAIRQLRTLQAIYIGSSVAAVALMLYKGLAFIVSTGLGLEAIDDGLFFGSVALRSSLFGVVHTSLAVSLVWYIVKVNRALRTLPR